jgi:hypothetical protein
MSERKINMNIARKAKLICTAFTVLLLLLTGGSLVFADEGKDTLISGGAGNQYAPAIWGDTVVWNDDRNVFFDVYYEET